MARSVVKLEEYRRGPPGLSLEGEQKAALEARDKGNSAAAEADRWYLQCGLHLRNVKAALPHGQFLPWCKANGISPDQAKRWMREAADPVKREKRLEKHYERKRGNRLPHLPASTPPPPSNFSPEIDSDLVAAPEPDLPADIFRAFKTITEALPRLTKAQRAYVKRSLPRSYRKIVGDFFFASTSR